MAEKKLNLYEKLLEMQKCVVGLGKDKKAFDYSYVTGDKVLSYFKPLMNEYGLILKQEVLSIENTRQDYLTAKGIAKNEILSKVMLKFTWVDCESGDKDENLFGSNGQNGWDKGVGSALTYGERYFLLKFFHIATDADDIDNPERKPEDNEQQPNNQPQPQTKSRLTESMTAYKTLVGRFEDKTKSLSEKEATLQKAIDTYEISQVIVDKLKVIISNSQSA